MRPGTYFTSISTSSPFSSVALRYLYLVFLAWYLRTSPATPFFLYAATHRSRVRLPYGHILAASTTLTSFCAMGNTHRSRSSKISFAILTISGCYPKTAICLCTLPPFLESLGYLCSYCNCPDSEIRCLGYGALFSIWGYLLVHAGGKSEKSLH